MEDQFEAGGGMYRKPLKLGGIILEFHPLQRHCHHAFWAAAPKGQCPVEHRWGILRRPSVHPPHDHQGLKLALPGLSPLGFKSALLP